MAKKDYILQNARWLEEKGREGGVRPLPRGLFYRVIEEGDPDSPTPTMNSVVTVNYSGSTIDGRVFDSNLGEVAAPFRLRDLIAGWCIALQKMHIGDRWEVYIPADQAYGKRSQPGIPGGSTLVFDIRLTGIA